MNLFQHPALTNDFKREIDFARSVDPTLRAKAREPFITAETAGISPILFTALGRCVPLRPVPGAATKPCIWLSPQTGPDNHIAIVIFADGRDDPICAATNAMPPPVKTSDPCPNDFAVLYQKLRSNADQIKLIHDAVSAAASAQLETVERVCAESNRYRTATIHFLLLAQGKPHYYVTTALVEGERQYDKSRQWTGRVRP